MSNNKDRTEEDTFNRLRRPTFDELQGLMQGASDTRTLSLAELNGILRNNHWTWGEFWEEVNRRTLPPE